ncbi:uncharacterized protein LOC129144771 [Talpa occidentalis]|uniref:uncharacterized protein LOC129144771 n=1 Tax=Talpa occidentalis TaxID=50954 RepID=UPI0023F983B8|nr:uncharacterized protein LOC129144771 [Talpa occidentalis]
MRTPGRRGAAGRGAICEPFPHDVPRGDRGAEESVPGSLSLRGVSKGITGFRPGAHHHLRARPPARGFPGKQHHLRARSPAGRPPAAEQHSSARPPAGGRPGEQQTLLARPQSGGRLGVQRHLHARPPARGGGGIRTNTISPAPQPSSTTLRPPPRGSWHLQHHNNALAPLGGTSQEKKKGRQGGRARARRILNSIWRFCCCCPPFGPHNKTKNIYCHTQQKLPPLHPKAQPPSGHGEQEHTRGGARLWRGLRGWAQSEAQHETHRTAAQKSGQHRWPWNTDVPGAEQVIGGARRQLLMDRLAPHCRGGLQGTCSACAGAWRHLNSLSLPAGDSQKWIVLLTCLSHKTLNHCLTPTAFASHV